MSIVVKAGTGLVAGMVAGLLGLAFMAQVAPNALKPRLAVGSPQFVLAKETAPPPVQAAPAVVAAPARPVVEAKAAPEGKAAETPVIAAPQVEATAVARPAPPETAPSPVAILASAVSVVETPSARPSPASASKEAAARWSVPGLIALSKGDLSTARLFLARAAEAGDARAWVALADTFDPAMLVKLGVVGAPGDSQRARDYLAKAAAAGIVSARDRMAALEQATGSVR